MADLITVAVIDVNGAPVPGAMVGIGPGTGLVTTDRDGIAKSSIASPSGSVSITVAHSHFVSERVDFRPDLRQGQWNNALVQRRVTPTEVVLTVRLGRCSTAPTAQITEADLDVLAASGGDPHAALLFKPPRFPNRRAYRFQWNDPLAVELAEEILLPPAPPAAASSGWRRFQSKPADPPADVAALGRFFWLMFPAQPLDPQFVAAVWSPNINSAKPLKSIDIVVFFTPTTGAYTARYPFGVTKGVKPADQTYMSLGKKYLLEEYGFAYDLIARRRQAIVIMPICAAGDWGPFDTRSGLYRLCREVILFLHRECRTSNLALTQLGGTDQSMWLAGGSLRSAGAGLWSADFGAVPDCGRIAVSGFSSGIAAVKKVMRPWEERPSRFPESFWGCSTTTELSNPKASFDAAWQELWDLDGYHPGSGGWRPYLEQLDKWCGEKREIRLCHSGGRVPQDPRSDTHKLWKRLIAEGVVVDRSLGPIPGLGFARELHGRRWSAVSFDNTYIETRPPAGTPALSDAHHATPKVGFSHITALSSVGAHS